MLKALAHYSRTDKLIIASGVIGNLLETFDVMLCVFLAKTISITFFPANSSITNLFYTFNVFLVGYLSRPIGGLLIGLYADQFGRKKMLIFSIMMVGLCTAMIGMIPSYQSIGIYSTLFFLLFRILQNISVSGEYISSIAYLIESAEKNKCGFYGCWVSVGLNSGILLASLIVFILTYLIDTHFLGAWGWRIAFLSAITGMLIGLCVRYSLPESLGFILENSQTRLNKKWDILKSSLKFIKSQPYQSLSIMAITWLGVSETSAIFVYTPIHMVTMNHFTQHEALGINSISLLFLIVLIPIFGFLSDHYHRIKMLLLASSSFSILAIPYFWYLSHGTYTEILAFKLLFSIPSACFYSIAPVLITETLPIKLRCTSLALIYQITASLAAGLAPIIMLYLAQNTQTDYSPAYFLVISSALGLIGLYALMKSPLPEDEPSTPQRAFIT